MLVTYLCRTCQNKILKLTDAEVPGTLPCAQCSGFLERQIEGPSSNAIESVDNGFMVKAVDFDANRNDLRKEAADKFLKEVDKK